MDWIFDGGRPCIDLVNTLRDRHLDGRELLIDPHALTEWLTRAGLLTTRDRASTDNLAAARQLREAIDRLGRGAGRVSDARILNHAAQAAPTPWLRRERGRYVRATRSTAPAAPAVPTALAVLAVDAIDLVAAGTPVRVCISHDCGVRFIDTSPQHNRQWCSMSRCGNRAKARAHYARRAEATRTATAADDPHKD